MNKNSEVLSFFARNIYTSLLKSLVVVLEFVLVGYFGGTEALTAYGIVTSVCEAMAGPILRFQVSVTYALNHIRAEGGVLSPKWVRASTVIALVWALITIPVLVPTILWLDSIQLGEHVALCSIVFALRTVGLVPRVFVQAMASYMQADTSKPVIARVAGNAFITLLVLTSILGVWLGPMGVAIASTATSVITFVIIAREYLASYETSTPDVESIKYLLKHCWWNWFISILDNGSTPIRSLIASTYGAEGLAILTTYRILREPAMGMGKALYDTMAQMTSRYGRNHVTLEEKVFMSGLASGTALMLIPLMALPSLDVLRLAHSSVPFSIVMTVQFFTVVVSYGLLAGTVQGSKNGPRAEALFGIISTWLIAFPTGIITGLLHPDDMTFFGLGYFLSSLSLTLLLTNWLRRNP